MFSVEIDLMVRKEQYKDWQRQLEYEKLLHASQVQAQANKSWSQGAALWLGGQMTKWGTKLQDEDPALPSTALSPQK